MSDNNSILTQRGILQSIRQHRTKRSLHDVRRMIEVRTTMLWLTIFIRLCFERFYQYQSLQ